MPSDDDLEILIGLGENLWREETRFDPRFMEQVLAPDFFEYGRSGNRWTREQVLGAPRQPIEATLPLPNLQIRLIDENTAQITYNSAVKHEGVV